MALLHNLVLAPLVLGSCSVLFSEDIGKSTVSDATKSTDAGTGAFRLTPSWQFSTGNASGYIGMGPNEKLVIAGAFAGELAIADQVYMSTAGSSDVVLLVLDTDGGVLDFAQFGSEGVEFVTSLSVSPNNDVVIGGGGGGAVNFGTPFELADTSSPFTGVLAMYDAELEYRWSLPFSGVGNDSLVSGLGTSSTAVFACGDFFGSVLLPHTDGLPSNFVDKSGGRAGFFSQYGRDGEFAAGNQFLIGGAGDEHCKVAISDGVGASYVAGHFTEELAFAELDKVEVVDAVQTGIFFTHLGNSRRVQWHRQLAGNTLPRPAMEAAVAPDTELILALQFAGALEIEDLQSVLIAESAADIALLIVDPNTGNIRRAQSFPSIGADRIRAVAVNSNGDIAISGFFTGSITFGGDTLVAVDASDAFFAVFDRDGQHLWSQSFGTVGLDSAEDIEFDGEGNIYLSVRHQAGLDVGLGPLSGANQGVVVKFERR